MLNVKPFRQSSGFWKLFEEVGEDLSKNNKEYLLKRLKETSLNFLRDAKKVE